MPRYAKWMLVLLVVVLMAGLAAGTFLVGTLLVREATATSSTGPGWNMMNPWPGQVTGGGGACNFAGGADCPHGGSGGLVPSGAGLTMQEARQSIERYLDRYGNPDLVVEEVMEFAWNYYALVEEEGTGIGAFEVLVDKSSGTVRPEPGPNMMWNARYGMMGGRGMMGGSGWSTGKMLLSPEDARSVAQQWLDRNLPGVEARPDDVDPFYGYYTLHVWQDGRIYGMLSVHGETGRIWYHSWHGAFIDMAEEGGDAQ